MTAEGAMAHALSRAEDIPPVARIAFYSGWTGIAYALAELGETAHDAARIDRAFALIAEAARGAADKPGLDVIGGAAGAIPAMIALGRRHRRDDLVPLTLQLGQHLIATARRSEAGLSWDTLAGQTTRDPTGFSHGAAGIAWALLELYAATGDTTFREAAERGFAYERRWFSPEQENWPDFRSIATPAPESGAESYALAWCHGAPGIGLSRLRAYELAKSEDRKGEAEAAIRTTTKALAYAGYGVQSDFSLCHGRAGNAELLIYAGELGDAASRANAETLGRQGIEYFDRNRLPWPCGVPGGGESPSLMLGLAGIGHFYLRLHDPARVASVLIIRPPGVAAGNLT
jgi:lantibiotic modifying enzyme